ncbi:MAG: transposase [Sulfurospirillaceae bacterium]|nr:transposase [Sulfurospirillaceae bacterium]
MARMQRLDLAGYYHVVNRGVEQRDVFLDTQDFEKFLDIIKIYALLYEFQLEAYCLMSNHYHLLLLTCKDNLSLVMKQINYNYTRYFNSKYQRVGYLWQGRFKSFFVHDETYLDTVIKYIEYNPIKANITQNIGQYPWASKLALDMEVDEAKAIEAMETKIFTDTSMKKQTLSLKSHFEPKEERAICIQNALKDGYAQTQIAKHLGLSDVSISKTLKIHRQKVRLFEKLRDKGIFWSYSKDMTYEVAGEALVIEYILKYADFDEIKEAMGLFGKRAMKKVWEKTMVSDKSFIKTNFMLARVFFGMDVESEYFKRQKNERFEKLKMLAS